MSETISSVLPSAPGTLADIKNAPLQVPPAPEPAADIKPAPATPTGTPTPVPVPTPTPIPTDIKPAPATPTGTPTPVPVPTPTPTPTTLTDIKPEPATPTGTPTPVPVPTPTPTPPTPTPTPTPPTPTPTPTPPPVIALEVFDQTTGQTTVEPGAPYPGPVAGITSEFVDITPHNLNIAALTPNVYIHTGDGNDGINVSSRGGNNVLDGEGGSNFLVGGNGNDTFLVNDLYAKVPSWTTMEGFHKGDAATIWGLTPKDFQLAWMDNGGAAGHTGLTLYATSAGKPEIAVTIAGASIADISSNRLAVQFGTVNNLNYMEINRLG